MCLGLSGKVCLTWSWVKLDFLSITFSNITCNTLDTINIVLILRKFKALKFYQGFSQPRIFQFFIKANFFQIGDTKIFLRSRLFFFWIGVSCHVWVRFTHFHSRHLVFPTRCSWTLSESDPCVISNVSRFSYFSREKTEKMTKVKNRRQKRFWARN